MANTIPVILSKVERKDYSAAGDSKKTSSDSTGFAQVFSAKTNQQQSKESKSKVDTNVATQQSKHNSKQEETHKSEKLPSNKPVDQPKKVVQENKNSNQEKQNLNKETADTKQEAAKCDEGSTQPDQTSDIIQPEAWLLSPNLVVVAQLKNQVATASEATVEVASSEVASNASNLNGILPIANDFHQVQAQVLPTHDPLKQTQANQIPNNNAVQVDENSMVIDQHFENLVQQASLNKSQSVNQTSQLLAGPVVPSLQQITKTIDLPQVQQELQQQGINQSEDVALDSQPILNQAGKEFLFGGVVPENKSAVPPQPHLKQNVQLDIETVNSVSQLSLNSSSGKLTNAVLQHELSDEIFSESSSQVKSSSNDIEPNFMATLVKSEKPIVATSSQVATTQHVQRPDVNQIISQIVEQAKMTLRPQNSEMVIHLKPEHLGEMTLKVSVDQGSVQASFHTNNPEVRQVLETSLLQLKSELQQAGLKVENVGVYTGMNQFMSDQQQRQPSQNNKFSSRNIVQEEIDETFSQAEAKIAAVDGVDYRI